MLVEIVRLAVTLIATVIGYRSSFGSALVVDGHEAIGALMGALVGYIVGGLIGRAYSGRVDGIAKSFSFRQTGPQMLAGIVGSVVGLLFGLVLALPLMLMSDLVLAVPTYLLIVVMAAGFGARFFTANALDFLANAGVRPTSAMVSKRLGSAENAFLIDSSAAIDGRILDMVKTKLVDGQMWIPGFVLDEMQGLADASDISKRRRGMRGLDVVHAMRSHVDLLVLDETVPEIDDVDAKLVHLAAETGATLITTDQHLAKAAEVRGIRVVNPAVIADHLKRKVTIGEQLTVNVSKAGTQDGQGVAYLDDGTMVIVESAQGEIGNDLSVEVVSTTKSAVGQLLFARKV